VTAREYLDTLPFAPDEFQVEAAEAIDRGQTVVVAAPTGSGKTVVAEAAMARALGSGRRALYTTPLKALSNQKYGDFCRQHDTAMVGLLTGDNSINGRAPIVVMTTEVLRNMMYARSPDLGDVGVVVLDEVHYLADRARGPVWEEIIIHLDRQIPLVCLSATVANADEFAAWVEGRRGPTRLVLEEERAVPLDSEYLIRDRWERGTLRMLPVFDKGRPNERIVRMVKGRGHRYASPRRIETCEFLRRRGLLPAIYFIFSRAGCDAAAGRVVEAGLRLTTGEEARRIGRIAEEHTAHLSSGDLNVLGYGRWLGGLEAGVATHHAGLVPAFKETAECLFAAGLVKLVFATETLSLGINMPARTVVLESLSKFSGEGHELMSAGDYTQLTGRAGRRGIDTLGTAVVLHTPHLPFQQVAAIAAAGSFPLRSAFVPRYNMVANLIAAYPRDQAETLLNASFARFHEDRSADELEVSIAEEQAALAADRRAAECQLGDIWAFADQDLQGRDVAMGRFIAEAKPGDVLEWVDAGARRRHVVMARGYGRRPRLLTLTADGHLHRVASERLPITTAMLGSLEIPLPPQPRRASYRERVAARLASWTPGDATPRLVLDEVGEEGAGVLSCPRLQEHLEAVRRVRMRERRIRGLRRRRAAASRGMVPVLEAILGLLGEWGYVADWALTQAGRRLRFIYNELDLVLAECLERGVFAGLDPAETAALASVFTYEPRAEADSGRIPTASLERCVGVVAETWERLASAEEEAGLALTRPPESGFVETAYRWANGSELHELFEESSGGVGDFVRNCRQLIDLVRQIADVAPELERQMRAAAATVDRGVVAAAGAI
jgi:ATP-dependent RNA helicase HelY